MGLQVGVHMQSTKQNKGRYFQGTKRRITFSYLSLRAPVTQKQRKGEQASCSSDVMVIPCSQCMQRIHYTLNVQEIFYASTKRQENI